MASLALFTLARFTPYEWVESRSHRGEKYLVNNVDMSNSFWFIAGTFLRQATGVTPQVFSMHIKNLTLRTSVTFALAMSRLESNTMYANEFVLIFVYLCFYFNETELHFRRKIRP